MTRFERTLALAALMIVMTACVQASQKLNLYLGKDAMLAHDVSAADIRIRPEGMVRVTRHALWPWDEEGTRWSAFVEIENTSQEKLVIDEDWLIACRANRDEIATADYVFEYTTNVLAPGEKAMLYAGVYPYPKAKRTNADATLDTWDVEGLSDFAGRIRQAKLLRVRLEVRGQASTQNWPAVAMEPRVFIEGRTLCFEWINDTLEPIEFRTVGAVMSDAQGRIVDVVRSTLSRGAVAAPGEALRFQRELAPYVTQEMIDGAVFAPFAYRLPASSGDARTTEP